MAIESRYVVSIETAKQIWQTEEVYAQLEENYEFLIETEEQMNEVIKYGLPVSVEQRK